MIDKNKKMFTIVALMIVVVGLGIGFAAFSSTLTLNSTASVTPDSSTFLVRFSSSADSFSSTMISPEVTGSAAFTTGAALPGGTTLITNTGILTVKNPGDSITYNLWIRNDGQYKAYLHNVNIGAISCKKSSDSTATDSLVTAACNSISVKMCITNSSGTLTCWNSTTDLNANSAFALEPGASVPAQFIIEYASNGARADGDFDVTIGTTSLVYSSN